MAAPAGAGAAATELTALKRLRRLKRERAIIATLALLLCVGAATAAVVFRRPALRACAWIGERPPAAAGALYATFLALWLFCLLPTSLLEIAAGFIFGFWRAFAFSTLGKTLGSLASFGAGSYCRDAVRARFLVGGDQGSYLKGLELALKLEPFPTCLALRLAYLPEAVQNYVPAVFEAPLSAFLAATALGSALYACLWAKLGSQLGSAAEIDSQEMTPERAAFLGIGAISLLAVFGFVHWNTKKTIARFRHLQTSATAADDSDDQRTRPPPAAAPGKSPGPSKCPSPTMPSSMV